MWNCRENKEAKKLTMTNLQTTERTDWRNLSAKECRGEREIEGMRERQILFVSISFAVRT